MDETNKGKEQELAEIMAQRRVLKSIISKGTKFSVTYTERVRQKGLLGFFKPKVNVERNEEFVMKEPTLNVLDRASEVWLKWHDVDGDSSDAVEKGVRLAKAHAKEMAECIAILVLGEAYNAVEGGDEKELRRLTELFYKTIKPSQCDDLATIVNATMNIVDFVSSMRLMKMSATTAPPERIGMED